MSGSSFSVYFHAPHASLLVFFLMSVYLETVSRLSLEEEGYFPAKVLCSCLILGQKEIYFLFPGSLYFPLSYLLLDNSFYKIFRIKHFHIIYLFSYSYKFNRNMIFCNYSNCHSTFCCSI